MANENDWDKWEWVRNIVIVWGAAAILGGSNGYLSHPQQPTQPVASVQTSVQIPKYEDARLQFFYLTGSLSTVKQRLNKSSPDTAVVADILSITKQLNTIPDDLPWDAVMKHRLDTAINDWDMTDVQPKKKDDPKREDIEQMEYAVSKLVERLQSLCKG